jgi:hypothetical protein
VGAGSSRLVDCLLEQEFRLSETALATASARRPDETLLDQIRCGWNRRKRSVVPETLI